MVLDPYYLLNNSEIEVAIEHSLFLDSLCIFKLIAFEAANFDSALQEVRQYFTIRRTLVSQHFKK